MLILGLCQLTEHTGERLEIMSEKKRRTAREKEGGWREGGMEGEGRSSWQSDAGERTRLKPSPTIRRESAQDVRSV